MPVTQPDPKSAPTVVGLRKGVTDVIAALLSER
jgi:hypothetical protein